MRFKDIIFAYSIAFMTNNPHYNKGLELLKVQKFVEAIHAFTLAINLDPKQALIYSERGVAYMHLKRFDKAIQDMDIAANLEPSNPYRYSSRAFVKGAAGDIHGGIKDYEKAIELDPEDAISYNNLGLLQEKLGYDKQSKKNFSTADHLSSDNPDFKGMFGDTQKSSRGNSKILDTSKQPKVDFVHPNSNETPPPSMIKIISNIFTSKSTFKEFMDFISNGFKFKKK